MLNSCTSLRCSKPSKAREPKEGRVCKISVKWVAERRDAAVKPWLWFNISLAMVFFSL